MLPSSASSARDRLLSCGQNFQIPFSLKSRVADDGSRCDRTPLSWFLGGFERCLEACSWPLSLSCRSHGSSRGRLASCEKHTIPLIDCEPQERISCSHLPSCFLLTILWANLSCDVLLRCVHRLIQPWRSHAMWIPFRRHADVYKLAARTFHVVSFCFCCA